VLPADALPTPTPTYVPSTASRLSSRVTAVSILRTCFAMSTSQFTTRAVRLMSFTLPDLRTASMVELVTPDGPPALGVPLPLPLPASALGLADLSFLWAPPADALAATRL